uniref:Galectin n=1 Tax=Meloidogyne hapla TaxID=6305 RepID=A0A1I8B3X3_MELHA
MDAWFRRPYRNIPHHTSHIDTGSNQCPYKHIGKTIIPLKGFKAKKSIVIKITTDKYSKRAEFALQAKDGSNLVDIYITNDTILFGPGDAEGHWYPSKVKLSDSQQILESGKEIKITIQAFIYHIVILISGFPKMVSTFWPFFWWEKMPYMAVNNVLMTGDFALLRSVEMIDFDDVEHVPCPFSLHLDQVIKNKTRIAFRGIVHKDAKSISFNLLHDAPKWHKYLGATVMHLHINFTHNSTSWWSYYGKQIPTYEKVPTIVGFQRGKPFEFIIVITDHSSKENGTFVKYSAFINGEFIRKEAVGYLPIWTINWIRGEMEHFYKFQLKHLPYYGSRYCLEATLPPFYEMSERKGFEINFFHESTEFDENIGDTVLRMDFVFDIKNASNDLLFLNSYQHSIKSWDEDEIHPNPIGRSGVSGDINNVLFGNNSKRCKAYYEEEKNSEREEHTPPSDIYQVDPNQPLKSSDLISIQGIVKLPEKFHENAVNICISFYHEALDWHFNG